MLHMPVSGMAVTLAAPDGADELAIIEARGPAVARALAILPRLARIDTADDTADRAGGDDWRALTVTDFEYALLALRRHLFGEHIACVLDCPNASCGERVEITFGVADFLDDVRPARPSDVRDDDARPGWFRLGDAAFRLPTVADQAAVIGLPDAPRRLAASCIDPADLGARARARIERAMERLAPEVSREVRGVCPACGNTLSAMLHVPLLVIEELRRAAGRIHDDIHLIADAYHWNEASILALPRARRQTYAERIRRDRRERG